MAIIDSPKPSEPKSPQPEQRPLQPGQTDDGRSTSASPQRSNVQTPDADGEESGNTRRKS
jgi:hypothetical protein